jgi:Fe(3+) dicitrate transport protein
MLFDNRTETVNTSNTDFIILNTGSSRHRGLEGELSYDFLARLQHPPVPELQPEPGKAFQKDHCFDIALTAVYVSQQFWQDTNIGNAQIPKAQIAPYKVFNLSGDVLYHQESAFDCRYLQPDRREILRSGICQWD